MNNIISVIFIKYYYENIKRHSYRIKKNECKNCICNTRCCTQTGPLVTPEKENIKNMPQHESDIQPETILKATGLHKDSIQKTDCTINVTNAVVSDKNNDNVIQDNIKTETPDTQHNKVIDTKNCNQPGDCGLLRYRKWWELIEVELLVDGKLITGIPIFVEENTLRVMNKNNSYFIPLEKVDYIRTNDGLHSSFDSPDDKKTL